MTSLSRAVGALLLALALVVALLAALPAGADAVRPFKLSSTPLGCAYDGTTLRAVTVAAPRAAMEATWRKPRGGHVFTAQYVYLVLQLQAEQGGTWHTVATAKRYTKVRAKLRTLLQPALPHPTGGSSYRVLQTMKWIKPTSRTRADKQTTMIVPGTCTSALSTPSPAPTPTPTPTPTPVAPPSCPTWDQAGDYTAAGWAGGSFTLTMTSTSSDTQTPYGFETRTLTVTKSGVAGSFQVNTNAWSVGETVTITINPVTITYAGATENCPSTSFTEVGTD